MTRGGNSVDFGDPDSSHVVQHQYSRQSWLRFRYDVRDNPLVVLLGRLALGPSDREPLELDAKIMQEIELVVKIACENISLAIQRNGR